MSGGRVVTLSAANSIVTASPATIENDGVESATITVVVRNTDGNPMPTRPVTLAFVSGTGTLTQPVGVTNQQGVITGSVVSSTLGTMVIKATVLDVDITDTVSVVVSGTASLYPNQPSGMTSLVDWNGSPRGTTDAFGVADFGAWQVDAGAPASNLEVVADGTNPVSGNALKLIWNDNTNPRCADATANPLGAGGYSEFYLGFYIKYVDGPWNHKFCYIGAPSVSSGGEVWLAVETDGSVRWVGQGYTGAAVIVDSVSGVITDPDVWYRVELYARAQSAPGVTDGLARLWVDGTLIDENTACDFGGGDFGSIEWYADNNAMPSAGDFEQRLGGLRIAGVV